MMRIGAWRKTALSSNYNNIQIPLYNAYVLMNAPPLDIHIGKLFAKKIFTNPVLVTCNNHLS